MSTGLRYRVVPALTAGDIVLGHSKRSGLDFTHTMLGRLAEQGVRSNIYWSFARETVLGIFGKRGSGKSYTLGVFLEGLGCHEKAVAIGINTGDRAVLVFDTLNIYQYSVVPASEIADPELQREALQNLKAFSLKPTKPDFRVSYPSGFREPFYSDSYESFAIDTALIRPEDYAHLFEIDLYREPMGHVLLEAYDRIKDGGYTANGTHIPGSEGAGLSELVDCLERDNSLAQAFALDTVRALLARLRTLHRLPLFTDQPTPLSSLLLGGSVRIILMGQLSPPLRSVVAALVTRQVFTQRARAAEASKYIKLSAGNDPAKVQAAKEILAHSPPRTIICIDEAQGYAPPTKRNPCTDVLIQFVKEGRNHGLSILLTSQQPSAIHPEILSQLDGVLAHRLTVPVDIEATLRNAKGRLPEKIVSGQKELTQQDLLRELSPGQAWVSHADAERSFVLEVRPRVTAHGGIEG